MLINMLKSKISYAIIDPAVETLKPVLVDIKNKG